MKSTLARQRLSLFASLLICAVAGATEASAAPPVIPGAAGFGMDTPAGRGGEIHRVTNLNDSGSGSLRACVEASGPRICIFDVSGSIRLESNLTVSNPNLTIAGQTAPVPGILLRGATLQISASDVLVQHLAVRVGDDPDGPLPDARDSLKIVGKKPIQNIVIDHASISWGIDEVVEIWKNWNNVTISNTIISEPLHDSLHSKGPHGLTALVGSTNKRGSVSLIGNLMAHGHGRNPRSSAAEFVFVNNVIYNGRESEAMLFNDQGPSSNSIVGNVFIKGANSHESIKPIRLVGPSEIGVGTQILKGTRVYLADNRASCATDDPWSIVTNQTTLARTLLESTQAPSWPDNLEAKPADNDVVLNHVLGTAGTRPAERNDVDARVVRDVRNGTGQIINCVADDGSSRCARNAGGWPNLASNVRRLEVPANPNGDDDGDDYTNVEEWLHGLAAKVEGRAASVRPETPQDDRAPPKPPSIQ
jgi:pectate lyase